MLPGTLSQVVSVAEQTTSLCCLLVSQASRWRVALRVTPSHPICRDSPCSVSGGPASILLGI